MKKAFSKKGKEESKKNKASKKGNTGKIFRSPPIKLHLDPDTQDFYRADIEFYGVDLSGPSYEGRVFLNNPDANENTPLESENGYVGSYHIFGHGGCFGDAGHCEITPRRTYDSRAQHALTPAFKSLVATNVIKKILKSTDTITITIVPIIARGGRMSDAKEVVYIERIRINGYENVSKLKNK
jgi:hypothetical protein